LSIAVLAGVLLAAGCADHPRPARAVVVAQAPAEDAPAPRKGPAKRAKKEAPPKKEAAPEPAKAEQPKQAVAKPEWRSEVVTGYGETAAAARANALLEAQDWLERELRADLKASWSVPRKLLEPGNLERMGVINVKDAEEAARVPFIKDVKDDEPAWQQRYKVTLTPVFVDSVVKEARAEWVKHESTERHDSAVSRQKVLLKGLGAVLALLLVVAGYLRLEEATRGFYTGLLRAVALGILALVALALLMIG
jgi:hypothetical protein